MGFRDWLEEATAQINPFDGNKTAKTVRTNRQVQAARTKKIQDTFDSPEWRNLQSKAMARNVQKYKQGDITRTTYAKSRNNILGNGRPIEEVTLSGFDKFNKGVADAASNNFISRNIITGAAQLNPTKLVGNTVGYAGRAGQALGWDDGKYLAEAGDNIAGYTNVYDQGDFASRGLGDDLFRGGIELAGDLAAFGAGGLAKGGVMGLSKAGTIGTGLAKAARFAPTTRFFTQSANDLAREMEATGQYSPQQSFAAGSALGGVSAGLERIGLGKIAGKATGAGVRALTTRLVSSGLTEAATEGAQTVAENTARKMTVNPEQNLFEGAARSALVGGLLGAGARGGVEAGSRYTGETGKQNLEQDQLVAKQKIQSPITKSIDRVQNDSVYQKLEQDIDTAVKRAATATGKLKENYKQEARELIRQRKARVAELTQGGFIGGGKATGFNQAQDQGKVFEGVDGKPRFEVDDSGAKLRADRIMEAQLGNGELPLNIALDHPKLFEQYPQLRNVKVKVANAGRGNSGSYDPTTNTITINSREIGTNANNDIAKNTLIHEIQHNIQQIEGFADGGSTSEFKTKPIPKNLKNVDFQRYATKTQIRNKLKELGIKVPSNVKNGDISIASLENPQVRKLAEQHTPELLTKYDSLNEQLSKYKTADAQYERLAGEAEARAVASRMNMTDGERYKKDTRPTYYHGTTAKFDKFSDKAKGQNTGSPNTGFGHFFIGDKKAASDFVADSISAGNRGKARIIQAKLDIKKPADLTMQNLLSDGKLASIVIEQVEGVKLQPQKALELMDELIDLDMEFMVAIQENSPKLKKALQKAGYDGSISQFGIDDDGKIMHEVVAFETSQIEQFTGKDKYDSTFYDSLDVPKQDLIVRDGSGKAMSVDPNSELGGTKAPVENKPAKPTLQDALEGKSTKIKPSGKKTNLGFIETVKKSNNTAPEVNKKLRNRKRDTITNQDTLDAAKEAIKKQGFRNAVAEAKSATSATVEIQAKSLELITQLQNEGDYDSAVEVVRSYAERAREAGQTVQIAAAYDRLTPEGILRSAQQQVERAKKKNPKRYKDLKITAEQSKKLTDMAKKVQAMPPGDAKILAQVKLQDEILKIVPTPASVKATTLWKAGLLTGIKGGVFGNTIGNSSMQLMKKVSDVPATAIDSVIGEWTGRRSKTFTLKGLFSGVGKGTKAGVKQFRQGTGLEDVSTKLDYDKTFYSDSTLGKIAQKYTDSVFGFYSAADKPFYFAALQNTLQDRASVEAKNKGLKGKAKRDFIAKTVKNPPTEMNELAVSDALTAVFQNKNALSSALSGFKKGARDTSPAAGAVTEVVLPFTGVPSNIAAAVYSYSPVKPLVDIVSTVKSKGEFDQQSQRQLVESVGKGITGTGIMWLGAQLVGAGVMTMGYPDDEEERALWEAEGKNEYSVKVNGKWRSLNYTGQLLSLLAIGGQYEKSKESGAGTVQSMTSGALSGAKGIIEGSPLQGANNFLEAIVGTDANGDGSLGYKADKYIQGLAGSTIPTIVKDVANATDPYMRDINQSENALQRYLLDPIAARTPGVSRTLPIKSDRFGNDKKRAQSSIESLIDPFRSSPAKSTSPTDELRRLYDGNKDTIFAPTRIDGKNFGDENMSAAKEEELKRVIGQNTQAAYDRAVKSDEYKRLDDAGKAKLIEDIRSDVYNSAKDQYKLKGEVNLVGNTPAQSANNTLSANDYPNLPQNETAQRLIADYEARVASGTYSEIDQVAKKRELVKEVYKSDFDDATKDFYSISSDANMRTAIENNLVTREQLQKAADTDVILTQLGIQKYLQIGKTLRADYGLGGGSTSSKTSSGSSRSSSKSSGSKKSSFKYSMFYGGSNPVSSTNKSLRSLLESAVVS